LTPSPFPPPSPPGSGINEFFFPCWPANAVENLLFPIVSLSSLGKRELYGPALFSSFRWFINHCLPKPSGSRPESFLPSSSFFPSRYRRKEGLLVQHAPLLFPFSPSWRINIANQTYSLVSTSQTPFAPPFFSLFLLQKINTERRPPANFPYSFFFLAAFTSEILERRRNASSAFLFFFLPGAIPRSGFCALSSFFPRC